MYNYNSWYCTVQKALQQPKFEVEALKIAEESLLKSPSFLCPFHTELDGFLVSQLKLFRLPDISVIRYQLARALLQNQVKKFYRTPPKNK